MYLESLLKPYFFQFNFYKSMRQLIHLCAIVMYQCLPLPPYSLRNQKKKTLFHQAQSDIEWKFGLSKLIRNMHRTTTAPSPLNLVTTWFMWIVEKVKVNECINGQCTSFQLVITRIFCKNTFLKN